MGNIYIYIYSKCVNLCWLLWRIKTRSKLFHSAANEMMNNTRGSCQCESHVIYSLVLKCETDTSRSKQAQPLWHLPSGLLQGLAVSEGLCVCSPSVYMQYVCFVCIGALVPLTQPWCPQVSGVCVIEKVLVCFVAQWRCTSTISSHLCGAFRRLLTLLPRFHPTLEYTDFEFGPTALWRLSQYWLTLPLNTSMPQGKTRCGALLRSESTQN